jgi:hypothetical protein
MNKPRRKASPRFILQASVALGLLAGFSAGVAAAAEPGDTGASCQQETRRVTVWPKGSPKSGMLPRFEERVVSVCNGKVVSWKAQQAPRHAKGQH